MAMLPAADTEARREIAMETVLRHIDTGVTDWQHCCAPLMTDANITEEDVFQALTRRAVIVTWATPGFVVAAFIAHGLLGRLSAPDACASAFSVFLTGWLYFVLMWCRVQRKDSIAAVPTMVYGSLFNFVAYGTLFWLFHLVIPFSSGYPEIALRIGCAMAFWFPGPFLYERLTRLSRAGINRS